MKLLFFFLVTIWAVVCQAHYDDEGVHFSAPRWSIAQSTRGKLRSICADGSCKGSSDKAVSRREAIRQNLIDFSNGERSVNDVDRHLDLIYEAKKAVLAQNGLSDVIEPHNDGLFGGDLLLNEEQAQWVIDQTKKNNGMDSNYNKQIAAMNMLSNGTCLKFVRVQKATAPVLQFAAINTADDGLCGYAYVGYQPKSVNAININFKSKICAPLITAVIAHEGMHVFGFMHEHTRYDRDQFITVNWTNVDPQAVDIFTKDDPTEVNPFCVPYDYQSIMHYDSYVGAKDYNYPAFWAKTNATYYLNRIGNYPTPSKNDILMMNKLYCLNSTTCKDASSSCGFQCNNCSMTAVKQKCQRSCNACTIALK
uniref:Metalloendopeptidase n=1 Tax=Romanomermis culicivorax TaxID=13658 RepID=A0A915JPS3_ROMCU